MASTTTDPELIATLLNRLERLNSDEYVLAFGPAGKHFFAGPDGYAANYLPSKPLAQIAGFDIKKILWASFGDGEDSWFFAYEFKNGEIAIRLGDQAPRNLHAYIDEISKASKDLLGSLRVQLGNNGSFVVWSKIAWACYGVPETLRRRLLQLTSARRVGNGVTKGSFKDSTIANVAWHEDGSCFLRAQNGLAGWVFGTNTSRDAWDQLWFECGEPGPGRREIADLTYVAIDPHAPTSDTFAFVKKKDRGDAPFVLHFPEGPVYARLAPSDRRLQTTVPEPSKQFRWATVTRSGRPHNDGWELEVKKGEKVKVWEDRSRDWFVVEGTKGKGYCHGSWLRFQDSRRQELSEVAWIRFLRDVIQLVGSSPIEQFPSMTDYVEACTVAGCTPAMADGVSLGVCAHNLEGLLRGSGLYSAEWLKKERVMWHPDRFAQFCVPAAAGQLKAKAEQLFVLYGVCLEEEKKRAGGSQ